jgi:hypothetical protein
VTAGDVRLQELVHVIFMGKNTGSDIFGQAQLLYIQFDFYYFPVRISFIVVKLRGARD